MTLDRKVLKVKRADPDETILYHLDHFIDRITGAAPTAAAA
jgi:hypothetical protein